MVPMADPAMTMEDLVVKAAAAAVVARGLTRKDGEAALAALGWAQGTVLTHEDAFRAFAQALIDEVGVPDLIEAKIELLGEYKLDYPQDYEPEDVACMQTELERLRSLQQQLTRLAS
ncbi:hypothetical protein A5N17_09900 [Arthrobacter sp. D2]|nr:hypothetical protein [Arthrobacter sp. M5]NKR14837.1 hypothetical protein [Arthrobacter sp. M6]OEH62390.1 hypothetical protein A5N13_01660 [Arthrobacter sp. D4]OEH62961.1 hypothetical protein A5N17_09900 [Arthrobacter sp. D2]